MYYSSIIPELYQRVMKYELLSYAEFLNLREWTISRVDAAASRASDPASRQHLAEKLMWKRIFPNANFPAALHEDGLTDDGIPRTYRRRGPRHGFARMLEEARRLHSIDSTDGLRHCALRFPTDPPANIMYRVDIIKRDFYRIDDSPRFPRRLPILPLYVEGFEEPLHILTTFNTTNHEQMSRIQELVTLSTDNQRAEAIEGPWLPRPIERISPSLIHNKRPLSEQRLPREATPLLPRELDRQQRFVRLAIEAWNCSHPAQSEHIVPLPHLVDSTPTCVICMTTIRDPVIVIPCSHRFDHQCLLAAMESLSRQLDPQTGELQEVSFKCMHCRAPIQAIFHTFRSGNTAVFEQLEFPNMPSMPFGLTTFSEGEEEATAVATEEPPLTVRWSGEFIDGAMFRMFQANT